MGLYLRMEITSGGLSTKHLGDLVIVREEALVNKANPDDEVHPYRTQIVNNGRTVKGPEKFEHRYGDGAWTCVRRALEALES